MELNNFKQKDFNRIAITERCLTVNNKNFNFFNGHVWTLDVNKNTEQIDESEATEDG